MIVRWGWQVIWVGFVVMLAAEARADDVVLPRPGQVGIGIQGQYGMLMKTGDLGETFDTGPGLAVRLRYRMRYDRGLGLSFESHGFDARQSQLFPVAFPDTNPDHLTLITSGVEIYQMFGTETRNIRMLSVGLGLAQVSAKLRDGETIFPDDGVYVSLGAGVERFIYRSWALDFSGRYFAVFQNGKTNHDLQASAGLIVYASY